MFSSELQLSSATAKLFHLEQFAIYGTLRCLLYVESCLSGRAYIGEVLIQIWLKSMQK